MAAKTLRPFASNLLQSQTRLPTTLYRAPISLPAQNQQRRTFFPNPFASEKQTLTASRTLSYPASVIYDTISDVSSYSTFIPYCQSSEVTKSSKPAANGKSYPEEAKLTIGFNSDVSEAFWSRIYCQPERVVEAVAGLSESALHPTEIPHHNARPPVDQDPTRNEAVLTQLATTWTLRPGKDTTDVSLAIEYQFANPVYGALSAAAAPKVAEKMIEAFENRVRDVVAQRKL
ncbi:hypothetical protein Q7P37_002617 [Cladosporium fusiforme]